MQIVAAFQVLQLHHCDRHRGQALRMHFDQRREQEIGKAPMDGLAISRFLKDALRCSSLEPIILPEGSIEIGKLTKIIEALKQLSKK